VPTAASGETVGEGDDSAATPQSPSSSGASAPGGWRAKLRALRSSPPVSAVVAGGARSAALLSSLPAFSTRARLAKLAKAADAAPEDVAKQEAYLEALARHRCGTAWP